MRKQYLLKFQFASDVEAGRWRIGASYDDLSKRGQRFYDSLGDAEAALARLTRKFNSKHTYNSKGERRETQSLGGGLAADLVITKSTDDAMQIVNWSIQVREVTEWEIVENSK